MTSAHRPGVTQRLSRRNVLLGAATVGAGGAVVSVASFSEAFEETSASDDGEAIVVHVRELGSGRLDVFVGDRRIEVRDRDLAKRLAKAARRG